MLKIWIDDIRNPETHRPGEGYHWAKTITEAIRLLDENDVSVCSIDHDISVKVLLGGYGDPRPFASPETYEPVARFIRQMIMASMSDGIVNPSPGRVYLHSANPAGRAKMMAILAPVSKIILVEEHPSSPCNRFEEE